MSRTWSFAHGATEPLRCSLARRELARDWTSQRQQGGRTAQPPCGQAWRPRFPEPDRGRHAEYLMQPRRAALIPGLPDDQHGLAVHHFCDEVRSLNEPRPDLEVFFEIETVIPPKLAFW